MKAMNYEQLKEELNLQWGDNPYYSDMRIICAPAEMEIENIREKEQAINQDIYNVFGRYIGTPEEPQPDFQSEDLGEWIFTTDWNGTDKEKLFKVFSAKYPEFAFGLILEPMDTEEGKPLKQVWYNGGECYVDTVYYDEYFDYSLPMNH